MSAEVESVRDPYRERSPPYDLMAADARIQAIYGEFQAWIRKAAKPQHVRPRVVVDLASSYQSSNNTPASRTSASTATRMAHVCQPSTAKGDRRDVVITASF